ncbi:hypothetical protein ACHHV8_25145 [Paenibacillus sp. TAB 01]|uniref:hypothetical protein n=1 Tax=Paenibacillus sp. TAB 01 TaxID=3368988 RepID=UPI003752D956
MVKKKAAPMTKTLHRALAGQAGQRKSRTLIPVIVQFEGPDHRKHAARLKQTIRGHRYREKGHLWLLKSWSAHVSPSCLKRICSCRGVKKVYLDQQKQNAAEHSRTLRRRCRRPQAGRHRQRHRDRDCRHRHRRPSRCDEAG